jgi:hypothetical protein
MSDLKENLSIELNKRVLVYGKYAGVSSLNIFDLYRSFIFYF